MRKGFTMIELIFVIVILGILAAIAIPRLAATRDDAEVAKTLSNLSTLVSDVTSNYTAKGQFADNIKDMTNVVGVASTSLKELNDAGAKTVSADYSVGNTADCLQISFIKNAEEDIFLFVGTAKLVTLQKAVADAKGELTKAEKMPENTTDQKTAKEGAIKAANEAITAADTALSNALSARGGIAPDSASAQCRTLTSTKSFQDIAGKDYKLSGTNVAF